MKRTGALLTALILTATLTACGDNKEGQTTNEPAVAKTVEETTPPTEAPVNEALYTEDEALEMMESVVVGKGPAISEWHSVANAVCAILDSEKGDPVSTGSTIAAAGAITGTDPETYTLRWDSIDGEGIWMIMFGSTQLACTQWGEAVGGISDDDLLVLNAAVEQISKK